MNFLVTVFLYFYFAKSCEKAFILSMFKNGKTLLKVFSMGLYKTEF